MSQVDYQARQIIARLDRIPIWPYPQRLLFIIGVGFFFGFFDIITIGLTIPVIEQQFQVTLSQVTWIITSSLIGYIVGSFIDSRIADLYGRKVSLYISISLFSIGSLLSATSTSLGWLIVYRFISGMGIGAEIAGVSTYLSEVAPSACRGRYTCWGIAYGMFGFAVVPFVGLALVPHFSWGWRVLFVIGGVGGIIICFMRRGIPHSVRWLAMRRDIEKADIIVRAAEQLAKKKLGHDLPSPAEVSAQPGLKPRFKDIFKAPTIQRIMLFASLWFIYYIGNYAWLTLATKLFIKRGFALSQSILFVAIASLGFVLGSLLAVYVGDKIERKWSIVIIALIWSAALMLIGWMPSYITIIVGGFIATTSIAMIIPLMYTYTAENFPTRFRETCVSITDGFGHIGGAFCGQIIFAVYAIFHAQQLGFAMAFTVMALTGLLTAILVTFGFTMTGRSMSNVEQQNIIEK